MALVIDPEYDPVWPFIARRRGGNAEAAAELALPENLYERDFHTWLESQAAALRDGRFTDIDVANLAGEIEDLAEGGRRELRMRVRTLIELLLRLRYEPGASADGLLGSALIGERRALYRLVRAGPSLRHYILDDAAREYPHARQAFAVALRLPIERLPAESPFSLSDLIDE